MRCMLNVFSSVAIVLAIGVLATGHAQAQVVNSGPSATSSTSQVTMKATVPSIVFVKVNEGTSTLTKSINPNLVDSSSNVASTDFQIRGDVLVNSPSANVQCTLSTLSLSLANGSDTITTALSGTIGGTSVSTSAFTPTFTNKKASIVINGDIDESTVTSEKAPGDYTGTLTISATLI